MANGLSHELGALQPPTEVRGFLNRGAQAELGAVMPQEELLRRSAALGLEGFKNVLRKLDPQTAQEFEAGDLMKQGRVVEGLQGDRDIQEIIKEFRGGLSFNSESGAITPEAELHSGDGVARRGDISAEDFISGNVSPESGVARLRSRKSPEDRTRQLDRIKEERKLSGVISKLEKSGLSEEEIDVFLEGIDSLDLSDSELKKELGSFKSSAEVGAFDKRRQSEGKGPEDERSSLISDEVGGVFLPEELNVIRKFLGTA